MKVRRTSFRVVNVNQRLSDTSSTAEKERKGKEVTGVQTFMK